MVALTLVAARLHLVPSTLRGFESESVRSSFEGAFEEKCVMRTKPEALADLSRGPNRRPWLISAAACHFYYLLLATAALSAAAWLLLSANAAVDSCRLRASTLGLSLQ